MTFLELMSIRFPIFRNLSEDAGLESIEADINVQDMLAYQKGDQNAFHRIYNRNKRKIYTWAFRMLRNEHSAEEISQEVFLRVSRAKDSYKPEAKFTTWVYTITSRLVFNEIRRKKRHPEKEMEDIQWQQVADISSDWMNRMETTQRKQMMERALEKIPERQRAALMLRYMDDMSHEQISSALGLTVQAVKSLLHRGLQSLTTILEEEAVKV